MKKILLFLFVFFLLGERSMAQETTPTKKKIELQTKPATTFIKSENQDALIAAKQKDFEKQKAAAGTNSKFIKEPVQTTSPIKKD